MELVFVKLNTQFMNEEIELAKLSNKELREVSGGGPLFRMLCLTFILTGRQYGKIR